MWESARLSLQTQELLLWSRLHQRCSQGDKFMLPPQIPPQLTARLVCPQATSFQAWAQTPARDQKGATHPYTSNLPIHTLA